MQPAVSLTQKDVARLQHAIQRLQAFAARLNGTGTEPLPKRRRRRRRKAVTPSDRLRTVIATEAGVEPAPKKRRGRRPRGTPAASPTPPS